MLAVVGLSQALGVEFSHIRGNTTTYEANSTFETTCAEEAVD